MGLWQRITQVLYADVRVGGCGHEETIRSLNQQIDGAVRALRAAEVDRDAYQADCSRLRTTCAVISQEQELAAEQITQLKEREAELLEIVEGATGRVTELEQLLRENGIDPNEPPASEQLPLVDVPEGGGEVPEQVIYDKVLRLPFGLVGVFLDGDGRRSWVIEANGQRAKVPVRDKEFLSRVAEGEEWFGHGDAIVVDVHTITRRSGGKVVVEYAAINKVVQLVHADEDVNLPFELPVIGEVASA